MARARMVAQCYHCNKVKVIASRGLCWRCYALPPIRVKYLPDEVHEPYTERELSYIRHMRSNGLDSWQIARELGCSRNRVRNAVRSPKWRSAEQCCTSSQLHSHP